MKTRLGISTIQMLIASSAAILVSVPALGHDPLQEDHERHHSNQQLQHHVRSPSKVNLSDVRSKVVSFRESGDDHHLDDAWAMLAPALATTSPDPEALIVASFVAQSRHQFDRAVDLITSALAINDNNDEAWLLLASIQLVLGETEAAAAACRQLRDVSPLVLLTCKGRVALATGDHQIAFERLNSVLNITDTKRLQPGMLAWIFGVVGDLAVAAGQPEKAMALFRNSLDLAERTQVRAALVDVLLSQADYDTAWRVLDGGSQALPLLVRRLIVAKHLGHSDELRLALSKVEQELKLWIADEDWLHAREMARFFVDVVDEPVLARRLALINIGLQKEPEDQRLDARTRHAEMRIAMARKIATE